MSDPCDVDWSARTLPAVLDDAVDQYGSGVAVIDAASGRTLTYVELQAQAKAAATGLTRLTDDTEARVVTVLGNHVEHVVTWFAIGYAGFVSVPINPESTPSQIADFVARAAARVIVTDVGLLPRVLDAVTGEDAESLIVVVQGEEEPQSRPGGPAVVPWSQVATTPGPSREIAVAPWRTHSVMFTSGSTGGPKSVVIPHAQTVTRAMVVDQRPKRAAHGVALVTVPLFHVAGQCRGVLGPLMQGMTVVVAPRFSVTRFWEWVERYDVTSTLLMGAMMEYLLTSGGEGKGVLEMVCAAPVTRRAGEFARRFGVEVYASYGSTEAGTVAAGASTTPGSLGWLHPDFEARIVDAHDIDVPQGENGELVLRARHPWLMTPGYEHNPAATVELWRNQWLHTGDLVHVEPDGELVFVERVKDIIRANGENITPADVEAALLALADVRECVALGVPTDAGDEIVKVVIVPQGQDPDIDDFGSRLAGVVPRHMFPSVVEFLDVIPRTPTEKVQKAALRSTEGPRVFDVAGYRPRRAI